MSFQIGAITLGGVDLNNSLQWVDRFDQTLVASTRRRTLGGNLVIFEQPLLAGANITLTATPDTGWFTYEMVVAIKALADVPGATHVFEFHGETYNVRFNYEGTPVQFTPLIPKNAGYANETDYFVGTLNLYTV